jgi:hypothetical protein
MGGGGQQLIAVNRLLAGNCQSCVNYTISFLPNIATKV